MTAENTDVSFSWKNKKNIRNIKTRKTSNAHTLNTFLRFIQHLYTLGVPGQKWSSIQLHPPFVRWTYIRTDPYV